MTYDPLDTNEDSSNADGKIVAESAVLSGQLGGSSIGGTVTTVATTADLPSPSPPDIFYVQEDNRYRLALSSGFVKL